jgi:hypothetical protein
MRDELAGKISGSTAPAARPCRAGVLNAEPGDGRRRRACLGNWPVAAITAAKVSAWLGGLG